MLFFCLMLASLSRAQCLKSDRQKKSPIATLSIDHFVRSKPILLEGNHSAAYFVSLFCKQVFSKACLLDLISQTYQRIVVINGVYPWLNGFVVNLAFICRRLFKFFRMTHELRCLWSLGWHVSRCVVVWVFFFWLLGSTGSLGMPTQYQTLNSLRNDSSG